jgi:asparagine synthase (glutamine-hydrolysing)
MMAAMVHRGPDDEGYEPLPLGGDGGAIAGFGFRRLSILDLSPTGHQPMVNSATGDCLVFNGEIYNFRELRKELESRGVAFRSTGDTEVLLQALSTWGEAALEKLEGMFAFAFYEAKSRRILLARDPLGIKPLYVAQMPDGLVFASEIRAVLASGLVSSDLDVAGIAGMLAYGAVQSPRTIYDRIRSFPAGASQWLDAGAASGRVQSHPRRYWSFPKTRQLDGPALAAENVRTLLHFAVLKHLVADVPVGVFLSAGIDSTIIASFAREYTPQVTAFTVGFGAVHGEDEVDLAAATAKSLGVKHVAVQLGAANMPDKWHDWLASMDSPSVDGFNTYVVSRRS